MLTIKVNQKDIEIVECEEFVRGTVGAKCVAIIDEAWETEELLYNMLPFDPTTQEIVEANITGAKICFVFKRYDMPSIQVPIVDIHEEITSLTSVLSANNKAKDGDDYQLAMDIPHEVLQDSGSFKIGFFYSLYYVYEDSEGKVTEGVGTTPTLWSKTIKVHNGTDTDGTTATQYTPTELEQLNSKIVAKQDKLIAGDNITIEGNKISATVPDLLRYVPLKHKHGEYLLYLDDVASQDTITELNITDSKGNTTKKGTLTIIDGTEPFMLKTNTVVNTKTEWSPSLQAVYKDGHTEFIGLSFNGDSNIVALRLEDAGIGGVSFSVDLQDDVNYSADYLLSKSYVGGDTAYKNTVIYFYVAPVASIKEVVYTEGGTWENIKPLLDENTFGGAPIYLFGGSNIDIKYSPCSQYTAMKDYVDDKVNDLGNVENAVLKTDLSTTPVSGKIPQYDSNLNLQVAYGTYGAGETEVKKWQDGAVPYNLFRNYIDYYDNKFSQAITDINTAKRVISIGVEKGVKYTFDWNAMYFFKSNTGKTDLTLLDSDGNNIIDTLKTSYGVLILPQSSYHRSEWSISADPTKYDIVDGNHKQEQLHGLFAGMTDKTALVTTDKIQMLQFDLNPDKTVSVTSPNGSVIIYKISF